MHKIAEFIISHRKLIYLIFIVLSVLCGLGMTQVKVEYSITAYLPQNTDTRKAIDIMDEEFTTYGSATMMVRNVSLEDAYSLADEIRDIDGVKELPFENTRDYYSQSCAYFAVTFEGDDEDKKSIAAYDEVLQKLDGYDAMVSSPLVDTYADDLRKDVNFVLILAVAVIVLVLCLTCRSLAEVPIFLVVFGVSALLNMGTNFFLGTISFISNSVCVILQLALAIDYSIILSNRFEEEKEQNGGNAREAIVNALAKAVPEIASSSLTTIAGLLALTTMTLRLGADLGIVLAKSIVCSMVTVFFLMPGLLLLFNKAINKTTHRSLIPKVAFIGKFAVKARYFILPLFIAIAGVCCYFSFRTDYAYDRNEIDTSRPTDVMKASDAVTEVFGYKNQFVILVPQGDYDEQKHILDMVSAHDMITSATGIANVEITSGGITHTLTDRLNYKEFARFIGADDNTASTIYRAYASLSKDDIMDSLAEVAVFEADRDIYRVSLLDMCDCVFDHDDFVYAYIHSSGDEDALDSYTDLRDQVKDAEAQLIGENYSRMLFNIGGDTESEETFALIKELLTEVKNYCPGAIFAGNSMSAYDLNESFSRDNIMVSLITVAFVFIILMFTFRSWGLPILLTLTIQSAIFINFAFYFISGTNVFFLIYLIVSSIQMGATIDYAIVLTNRFEELKKTMDKKSAVIEATSGAIPTILTSGTIMAAASFLIGFVVSDPLISTMGMCLGRGVIISILCVLIALPAMLYIFDKPLGKTKFKKKERSWSDRRKEKKAKKLAREEALDRLAASLSPPSEKAPPSDTDSGGGAVTDITITENEEWNDPKGASDAPSGEGGRQ